MNFDASSRAGPSSSSYRHERPAFPSASQHQSHGNPNAHFQNPHPTTGQIPPQPPPTYTGPDFDILDWYPSFLSCRRFFLVHAQHSEPVQAVCAFINIALPFQNGTTPPPSYSESPSSHSSRSGSGAGFPQPAQAQHTASSHQAQASAPYQPPTQPLLSAGLAGHSPGAAAAAASVPFISLHPYLRRLVATGFDTPPILHGFFGDNWAAGIGPLHESERRNYLFAAKAGNWLDVKEAYDAGNGRGDGGESVPFLKPLQRATEREIGQADEAWSEWMLMQDWMVGERGIYNQRQARRSAGPGAGFGRGMESRMDDGMDEESDSVRIKSEDN